MSPSTLALVVAGILGAVIGSFLNVCIHRLPLKQSVVWPSSRCPHCGRELRWYENVPVLSWLALRARCAGCGKPISITYPLVELVTAGIFVAAVWEFGLTWLLVVRLAFLCAMVVLAVTDLRHRILPNAITYPGIIVGLLCSLVLPPGFRSAAIGVLAGGGVPWLIGEVYYRVRGIEGLGMGDVKMLAMIGAVLGWRAVVVTLVLASVSGALVGAALLARTKDGMRYALPFGTFLSAGALVASLVGEPIVEWYLSFYP